MINLLDPIAILGRMFDARKFDDALNYCKTMLEKDPNNMMALHNSALALFYLEQFADAISFCDKILEINPNTQSIKVKICCLEKLGQYEEALIYCTVLLKTNPKDTWVLNSMGLSLNELDRPKEAISYYNKTLRLNKKDITALMNKALSLYNLGDYIQSITYYDRAQMADSSLTEASVAKSKIFEKLGLEDETFLAAQGVLIKDMEKIKQDAKRNKCTVFHQFCTDEYERLK